MRDCAVLIAIGILPDGHRTAIGVSCSRSEAEVHWRSFLESLLTRGMNGVQFLVSDDHSGLKAARKAVLPSVQWQRCQYHLMQNAVHYVPKVGISKEVAGVLVAVLNSKDAVPAREEQKRLSENTTPLHPSWLRGLRRMLLKD